MLRRMARVLAVVMLGAPVVAHRLSAQSASFDYPALGDEAVRLLQQYIAINTSNPPGNELLTARWLKDVLAREGIEGQILDTTDLGPGRANFYARLKGTGAEKAIALVHHMDVVPVTQSDWTVPAFDAVIKDGQLYGRGTLDMKGHGIMQLVALIAIKRAGVRLDRDLVYIANADEEINGDGSIDFVKNHRELISDVEFLLTEGDNLRVEDGKLRWFGYDVGEKRPLWLRMVAVGKTSHASEPIGDLNPVPHLARAVAKLSAWQTPIRLTAPTERFFKARAQFEQGPGRRWLADPAAALKNPEGRAWLLSEPERNALLRNTISPTVLVGSNRTNTIPQTASADLDIRLLPGEDPGAFKQTLTRMIADSTIHLEEIIPLPPDYDANPETALSQALVRVVHQMAPEGIVTPTFSIGASDRPIYANAGITCYGIIPFLAPEDDQRYGIHGNDERISVANVKWGVEFYIKLLQDVH
jgi:acetylornithine deacetylase/succinyl-diaminopimelate desuccinylase-like protein